MNVHTGELIEAHKLVSGDAVIWSGEQAKVVDVVMQSQPINPSYGDWIGHVVLRRIDGSQIRPQIFAGQTIKRGLE